MTDQMFQYIPTMLLLMLGLWLTLVVLLAFEALSHRWTLRSIPIRIHVNGTRGKTSVTRLIAAGLRGGGIRTCAKTTGSAAAMTDPDGREFPIYRIAGANILEQMRLLKRMAALKPQAVVIECMALQPHYQSLTELKMVRSNIGVITNARPDHLDVMGPNETDVALALAGSTSVRGDMFTAERDLLAILNDAAADRRSTMHAVSLAEVEAIDADTMSQFKYREHAENVALALKICEFVGVDRQQALLGMLALEPEAGAMQILKISYFNRHLMFVNAFAANDPESTGSIWENILKHHAPAQTEDVEPRKRIALINCRADRPHRSQQMAEAAAEWTPADKYLLIGSGTLLFVRTALKHGIPPERLLVLENAPVTEVIEHILEQSGQHAVIVGMCNIHGGGEQIARFFHNRAVEEVHV